MQVPHFYFEFEYKFKFKQLKKVVTGYFRMIMVHGIIKACG